MKKLLKYIHPASMKYSVTDAYDLEELKKELSIEMIKILFTPIGNWSWQDLETKKKSTKQNTE
ncbi:MAG: hypothetical protein WC188_12925 [Candidatus Caldatribacteriota bacterium]